MNAHVEVREKGESNGCNVKVNWSVENGWPTETFPYYIFQSQIIYKAGLKRYK